MDDGPRQAQKTLQDRPHQLADLKRQLRLQAAGLRGVRSNPLDEITTGEKRQQDGCDPSVLLVAEVDPLQFGTDRSHNSANLGALAAIEAAELAIE